MATPFPLGLYVYTDLIGAPSERLEVMMDDGELVARFADDQDGTALVSVADMAGEWAPA